MITPESPPQNSADETPLEPRPNGRVPPYASLIIALSVVGIVTYLVVDHWPHVLAAVPYLGIIAIAAMHLFGHRGHGGGQHRRRNAPHRRGGGHA